MSEPWVEPAPAGPQPASQRAAVPLPLHQPRVVYVLLAAIGLVFVVATVSGGSENPETLVRLGAQVNPFVAAGEVWRLFTAMFLHIGIQHILFNAWALFSVGRDVEAMYGSVWFTVIYLVAGLAGNIGYYWLGDAVLSAGASGAVFGLIGAEAAFFLRNRALFGQMGRQRLMNLGVLIAINLVFGFTVPGINNIAHLGGLFMGFALGLMLAPRFAVEWQWTEGSPAARWQDRQPMTARLAATLVSVALLLGGWQLGNARWQDSAELLRSQAFEAYDAQDWPAAQRLFEQAVDRDPQDVDSLLALGLLYVQEGELTQGVTTLERAYALAPEEPLVQFYLGAGYAETGQLDQARPLMERFLEQEASGDRADYARQVLQQ